jgi:DDE superfamily endonuclease
MIPEIQKLITFRQQLYFLFHKRKDAIMNLIDALCSYGHHCKSIVELCLAPCFKRQYSSITDAVADGLPHANWQAIKKLIFEDSRQDKNTPVKFIIDTTPNPRPFAKTLQDRSVTHVPNPAPGNKPIGVGHQYSVLAVLPSDLASQQKHWLIPISAQRVESDQKGNEVGMQQIISHIDDFGLKDQLTLSIGDSLYGTEKCRALASSQDNLVHIFRLNSKRTIFCKPNENFNRQGKGRKKEYGSKITLNDVTSHVAYDEECQVPWQTKKGKSCNVVIKCWKEKLLRGSRNFKSSKYPINVIQISVLDDAGKNIFKNPLWLSVFGKRRNELKLEDCFNNYRSRYDIEHFFRFNKSKLLMSSHQTPEVEHEQLWWDLCLVSYYQLFLAKTLVPKLPQPWERYLPEYKNKSDIASPSQTQRGFDKVLKEVDTPALPCIPRGRPVGRQLGTTVIKRELAPVKFKNKAKNKINKKLSETNILGFENKMIFSNPQKIDEFVCYVKSEVKKLGINFDEFTKLLINSS